jgi:hypothetical protein
MYKKILAALRKNSDTLEQKGFLKEAYRVDLASDLIFKIASNPSPATLRKDYGLSDEDLDKAYMKKIKQIITKKGFSSKSLGDIGDAELLVIEPIKKNKGKNLLIISGIHGDEQAGPFGLMRYLSRIGDKTLEMINLHFIPLYNPTGFRKCTRDNEWKEKTNRNFDNDEKISRESKIIKSNLKLIKEMGGDGILTMHEDTKAKVCFIYMYHGKGAEELGDILLNIDRMFFRQRSQSDDRKDGKLKDGIVWDRHENSFEDWINKNGIPSVAITETPGKEDFEHRVQANTMLLSAFVNYHIE